jgi:hypothetical protein
MRNMHGSALRAGATTGAMDFVALNDAVNLAHRLKEGAVFRNYLAKRLALVVPLALVVVAASIACTAATVLYIAGVRSFLLLLAIFVIPVVLAGSLFVQAYVLLSWLEGRALAKAFPHRKRPPPGPVAAFIKRRLGADMGEAPQVPWLLAAVALGVPLVLFLLLSPTYGLATIALLILAPVVYARLDR